jgi:hypothetical protein
VTRYRICAQLLVGPEGAKSGASKKTGEPRQVNDDSRARRPIQQPLEVEARELILRFFADVGGERSKARQKRRLPAWQMHSNNLLLLRCCVRRREAVQMLAELQSRPEV